MFNLYLDMQIHGISPSFPLGFETSQRFCPPAPAPAQALITFHAIGTLFLAEIVSGALRRFALSSTFVVLVTCNLCAYDVLAGLFSL